jgi:inhibitor of Bruton tyrosine kinase
MTSAAFGENGSKITTTMTRTTAAANNNMTVAKQLLNCLLHVTTTDGKYFLHTAFRDDLHMAKCLLERCRALDEDMMMSMNHPSHGIPTQNNNGPKRWQERFLLQANKESGYTPLHSAIVEGDLSAILLYLQYPSDHHFQQQYVTAPIAILQAAPGPHQMEVCRAVDAEGLTPLGLLGKLQISKLSQCRAELCRHALPVIPRTHQGGGGGPQRHDQRSLSFDLPRDEDEEISFRLLPEDPQHVLEEESMEHSSTSPVSSEESCCSYGFEVVTFGRPHHCALGVISGNMEGTTSGQDHHPVASTCRPQRVQEFAQERVLREGSAVAVAASTHHTLVVCRNGDLYVFGLNKSGRLGLGEDCPQQCPLPRRIMALKRRRVVAVAAAENHSLCVTSDGMVWSWGNNQFGQLGDSGTSSSSTATSRSVPKPVEDLKQVPCSAVAAGERHSVALSQRGEVYVWGNNGAGQMGVARRTGNQRVQRVTSLWNSGSSQQPCKVALAISAADQSTLVLIAPLPGMVQVNSVYWFGHGNHVPMKVQFDTGGNCGLSTTSFSSYGGGMTRSQRLINPVAVACAKYHNAVITSDGRVYTWGTSSESLGRSGNGGTSPSHRVTVSPQLVLGMLPENGGGFAVALSASEQHTAVVTNTGALFTWGVARGKTAMGHEGVRWQPSPKRVPGVHRAVSVAVAKEHTVVLLGTIFPAVPSFSGLQSLESLSAQTVVTYVDLFNVVPILIMAEHAHVRRAPGEMCYSSDLGIH